MREERRSLTTPWDLAHELGVRDYTPACAMPFIATPIEACCTCWATERGLLGWRLGLGLQGAAPPRLRRSGCPLGCRLGLDLRSPRCPAQPSPAQPSPAQPSPAQPSPAQPSPAQPSPAHLYLLPATLPRRGRETSRLELACAFLLTDRLWAVAMADLAQLAMRQQGEGGWEVLLAMAGRMRKRFRSTAAKIPKPRVAAVVSSLMQVLVAAGVARCLRLHQQLGAACNVTSQGNGVTAAEQVSPKQAGGASVVVRLRGPGSEVLQCLKQMLAVLVACQAAGVLSLCSGEGLAACQRAMMTMWQTISYDCIAHCPHTDIAAAATAQLQQASDVAKACEVVLTKVNALLGSPSKAAAAAQESRKGSEALDTARE
ncbi:hypothetical protein V8C86DRAFT_3024331 [Haematococcus lacustris]